MDIKELKEKSTKELQKKLAQLREKTRDLNFRIANKEVKNHQEYKQLRRDIARIKTLLKQRQIAEAEGK